MDKDLMNLHIATIMIEIDEVKNRDKDKDVSCECGKRLPGWESTDEEIDELVERIEDV